MHIRWLIDGFLFLRARIPNVNLTSVSVLCAFMNVVWLQGLITLFYYTPIDDLLSLSDGFEGTHTKTYS